MRSHRSTARHRSSAAFFRRAPTGLSRDVFRRSQLRMLCRASVARPFSALAAPRVLTHGAGLRAMLSRKRYRNRLWIDMPSGDFGPRPILPVDPWVLGALLGDGNLTQTTIRFSTAVDACASALTQRIDAALELVYAGGSIGESSSASAGHLKGVCGVTPDPLTRAIKALGLWGVQATTNSFRAAYLERRARHVWICCEDCSTRTAGSSDGGRSALRHRADGSQTMSPSSCARWAVGAVPVEATPLHAYRGEQREGSGMLRVHDPSSRPEVAVAVSEKQARALRHAATVQAPDLRGDRAVARLSRRNASPYRIRPACT